MATQREEIVIKAGFDNTALASGLRQASSSVTSFAKEIGRTMLAAFSAGAIIGQIENIFGKIKSLQAGASKTGLNVSDYQKLSTLASEELPDGAAKFDAALTKLNVNIGRGSKELEKWGIHSRTAEAAMYEIADKMHSMTDSSEKAAMAVDLMGKGGAVMVPFLERGAIALKAMAGSKSAWTEEEIRQLEMVHQSLEESLNKLTIWIGWGLATFGRFFKTLGELSVKGGMTGNTVAEVHALLDKWHAENVKAMDAEDARAAADDHYVSAAEKAAKAADYANRLAESKAEHEKEAAKFLERGIELQNRLNSLGRQARKQEDEIRKMDQVAPSIADLAGRGYMGRLEKMYGAGGRFDLGAGTGPFAKVAQQYELAQRQQMWDIIHGNAKFDANGVLIGGAAWMDKNRALGLHNQLAAAGLETPAMKMGAMVEHLADIRREMGKVSGAITDNAINAKIASD